MKFYIKESENAGTGTKYTACGQLTEEQADKLGKSKRGPQITRNTMYAFDTEQEYREELDSLVVSRCTVIV